MGQQVRFITAMDRIVPQLPRRYTKRGRKMLARTFSSALGLVAAILLPPTAFAQVDPGTVAEVIGAAVKYVQSQNAQSDQKMWEDAVSSKLDEILAQNEAIQVQIKELGAAIPHMLKE